MAQRWLERHVFGHAEVCLRVAINALLPVCAGSLIILYQLRERLLAQSGNVLAVPATIHSAPSIVMLWPTRQVSDWAHRQACANCCAAPAAEPESIDWPCFVAYQTSISAPP